MIGALLFRRRYEKEISGQDTQMDSLQMILRTGNLDFCWSKQLLHNFWIQVYFPTLLIRQKWHVNKRNGIVGDVCLLKDSNALRGEWRLVKVSETYPDAH